MQPGRGAEEENHGRARPAGTMGQGMGVDDQSGYVNAQFPNACAMCEPKRERERNKSARSGVARTRCTSRAAL